MKKVILLCFLIAFGIQLSAVSYAQTTKVDSTLYKKYLKDYKDVELKLSRSDQKILETEKQLEQMKAANNSLRGSLNTIAFYINQEKARIDSSKAVVKAATIKKE